MKKILSLIATLCLMLSAAIPASAAGVKVSLSGNTTATAGSRVTYTVNLSGAQKCTGGSVAITVGEKLEVTSGEFLKSGSKLDNFDVAKRKGAIAFKDNVDLNGGFFKFTVKALTAAKEEQTVSVTVTLANGAAGSVSKAVKVICANHTFGSYANVNASTHKRICSVCGFEETKSHTWNGGTVTKQANCKENGIKLFSCTSCGASKNETIAKTNSHSWGGYKVTKNPGCTTPGTQTRTCSVCSKTETQKINATGHSMGAWSQSKAPTCTAAGEAKRSCTKCSYSETKALKALGHSFSHPTVTKEPTCTEPGTETGKCSRCGQETSNSIKATGHKFGAWENVKEATCKEGGTQKRVCSKCKAEETKATEALGHDFENPTIVKAATISETGLKEGKCKRCGETTSEVIPCSAQDEATGTLFEANEGVFAAGTQLTVEEIKTDNPTFDSAKNILKDISSEFKLYDIAATLGGAEAAPNGEVKANFNIPDGYGKDIALYLIKADGTSEKIDCEISEDGKTLTARLTALGNYAICKLGGETATDTKDGATLEKPEKNSTMVYIIIVICAAVLIGGGIAFMVIKKKRIR